MSKSNEVKRFSVFDRRAALAKLGLGMAAAYAAPVLLKLSEARVGQRRFGWLILSHECLPELAKTELNLTAP